MTINSIEQLNQTDLSEPTVSSLPLPPKPKRGGSKWFWGLLLLITGTGAVVYQQVMQQQQQANQRLAAVPVERRNLTITVSANGTVEPEHVVNVSPKNAGIVTRFLVKESDRVTKGQVLVQMDNSNLQGQLLQEQGRLAQAEANLRKIVNGNRSQDIASAQARLEGQQANLRKLIAGNRAQDVAQAQARLDSAQAALSKAQDDFRRNQALYDAGAISKQALVQKGADKDSASAQVAAAQQALSLQKAGTRTEEIEQARAEVKQQQQALNLLKAGSRTEDIDSARAEVTAARGSLQNIQTQVNDTMIRAPFDGVVVRKYADPGAFVTPMTAGSSVSSATSSSLLALADTSQVVANVAESSIDQIRLNQPVTIKADAFPGQTFFGRVSEIATSATVEQNVTSFKVKVALNSDAKQRLRAGMNVSVEFQVGQLQNVVTVPTVAVTRQHQVTGVLVGRENQPPAFTPITTGATVNNRTEVKAGLNGTERVVILLPPKTQPQAGISVPGLSSSSKNDGPPAGGGPPAGSPAH